MGALTSLTGGGGMSASGGDADGQSTSGDATVGGLVINAAPGSNNGIIIAIVAAIGAVALVAINR